MFNYFQDQFSQMVYEEQNIPILCEIVTLLTIIYEQQETSSADKFILFDVMSYPTSKQSYKDVKIRSFQFWKKIVDQCLSSQGMVDGKFPEVTFSKVYKKIVNLNNLEIRRRLYLILDELSENGCLAVLSSAFDDEYDVQKAVMEIMDNFFALLKKYDILQKNYDLFNDSEENESLLATLEEIGILSKVLGRKIVSPGLFLNKLNKQILIFDKNEKTSTREELELLLEEILNDNIIVIDL